MTERTRVTVTERDPDRVDPNNPPADVEVREGDRTLRQRLAERWHRRQLRRVDNRRERYLRRVAAARLAAYEEELRRRAAADDQRPPDDRPDEPPVRPPVDDRPDEPPVRPPARPPVDPPPPIFGDYGVDPDLNLMLLGPSYDALRIDNDDPRRLYELLELQIEAPWGGRLGIGSTSNKYSDGYTFRDMLINSPPWKLDGMWGARCYNVKDWLVQRVTIERIMKEHGLYLNLCGNITVENCLFREIGAQAIQFVYREEEFGTIMKPQEEGLILIQNNKVVNAGNAEHWGRASFAISCFQTVQDVRVVGNDVTIDVEPFFSQGQYRNAHGGLLIGERGRAVVNGNTFILNNPDRSNWKIRNVNQFVAKNNIVRGGVITIENCPNVTIESNMGDCLIKVDGQFVSNIREGYTVGTT